MPNAGRGTCENKDRGIKVHGVLREQEWQQEVQWRSRQGRREAEVGWEGRLGPCREWAWIFKRHLALSSGP